jgi:hypothetical protein
VACKKVHDFGRDMAARVPSWIKLTVAVAAVLVSSSWLDHWPWGVPALTVIVVLLAVPTAFAAAIAGIVALAARRWRLALMATVLPICTFLGPNVIHHLGLRSIATRGDRIVVAVRQFEHDRGGPPKDLAELIPTYLQELPPASASGDWSYRVSGDKSWYLSMGLGAWEVLGYRSDQNYQRGTWRVGAWERRH